MIENMLALGFMIFALGYFTIGTQMTWKNLHNNSKLDHKLKVREAKEFGYEGSRLQADALKRKPRFKK